MAAKDSTNACPTIEDERSKITMKPFRKHVAIAVDGGGIKGVIEITEATEWTGEY
jgi:hypothetical protein